MPATHYKMNRLPIASRELRVAARKRSTFWLRGAAALTALVVASGCLVMFSLQGAVAAQMGSVLFAILTWICLAAGLSAGLFFTSDCLSEEKREGTLGLLFLTELRGYDVALGKLLATSLRGFYALLAVFPILALTLLMGGITGAQYWQSVLALVNALFSSLAAGMLVSALSRDSQKALAGTLLLLLALALGGPLTDGIIAETRKTNFLPFWSLSSPAYTLTVAGSWSSSLFWRGLAMTQSLGWGMLALACLLVPRTWQDRKRKGAGDSRSWAYTWKYGGVRRRARLRRKLLERQPIAWLVCREHWQSLGLWVAALLAAGYFAVVLRSDEPSGTWMAWSYLGGTFILILYLWVASQAGRFFVEARRSGLLELLLASPVSETEIVRAHWRAQLRMFGRPILLLLSVYVAGVTLGQLSLYRLTTQTSTVTRSVVTNQNGTVTRQTVVVGGTPGASTNAANQGTPAPTSSSTVSTGQQAGMGLVTAVASAASATANLLALCWFGMWMGLTSRSPNLATLKTLLFVQIIPWFIITFVTSVGVGVLMMIAFVPTGASRSATWFTWWPVFNLILSASLALTKDIGFILWSRKKLHSSFRQQAGQTGGGRQT